MARTRAAATESCKDDGQLRQEEQAKNTETIADPQTAQAGVIQALSVIKKFYAKAVETAALSRQQPRFTGVFDRPCSGGQGWTEGAAPTRDDRRKL